MGYTTMTATPKTSLVDTMKICGSAGLRVHGFIGMGSDGFETLDMILWSLHWTSRVRSCGSQRK